ncbi:phosphatase PAP2 family protein [Streptomyces sp. WM6378]|uniref:phosphatase PAP2 family protein n=1 Tax=Streptomyces sp. WM6378 TaxID=1415557 RepID=UPI0007C7D136|nr:phosphatase PAP2 family protein [Streptomyces sp. WM6378]
MFAGITTGTRRQTRPAGPETTASRPPLVRELLLVTALFLVYKFGRQLANGHEASAFDNADRVWSWERALHLPGEGSVQHLLLHGDTLVKAANTFYATVHFPATVAFLVYLYLRRPGHYLWSRRVLAGLTAAALVLHITVPLAPPRMLTTAGLVDTAQVYGPSVYAATPDNDAMANQFAAMPSLHFGWALMVAIGLIMATRSRWRWLWLLHPALTLFVVVGTANHYWLDAIVATVLLGAVLYFVPSPKRPARLPAASKAGRQAPASEQASGAPQTPAPQPALASQQAPSPQLSEAAL